MKPPLPPKKRRVRFLLNLLIVLLITGFFMAIIPASLNDARKPVIYLYPEEDTQVQVKMKINGLMYKDIPDYGKGWDIFVTKDGQIEGGYDYLFYEALLWNIDLPNEGWLVKYSDLENWFEHKLPELGLNEKEKTQFMEYWLESLPHANYYEIKLFNPSFLRENMTMDVEPKPDTEIRLLFYFSPLNEPKEVIEPTVKTPKREGFVVVEWGGILND